MNQKVSCGTSHPCCQDVTSLDGNNLFPILGKNCFWTETVQHPMLGAGDVHNIQSRTGREKHFCAPPSAGVPLCPVPRCSHPLPGSGRILWHAPAPSTLAVKMQLLARGKGRRPDNNPSHNKRKKKTIKRTDTVEKMQIATQQEEKGKAAVLPRLSGASAGAGG